YHGMPCRQAEQPPFPSNGIFVPFPVLPVGTIRFDPGFLESFCPTSVNAFCTDLGVLRAGTARCYRAGELDASSSPAHRPRLERKHCRVDVDGSPRRIVV